MAVRRFVAFVYRMTLALWTGAMAYLALVATYALFANLPRDEAGRAVAALFPSYLKLGYAAAGILFVGALLLARIPSASRRRDRLARARVFLTGAFLAIALYGGLVLFPKAAQLRARMLSPEPGAASSVQAAFRRVHGLAFGLNALALAIAGGLLAAETLRDVARQGPDGGA